MAPLSIGSLLAIPWLTGRCVDLLRESMSSTDEGGSLPPLETLKVLLLLIVCFACIRGITLFCIRWFIISASRKVEFDLRDRLFSHLQGLDRGFYDRWKTGDILARPGNR